MKLEAIASLRSKSAIIAISLILQSVFADGV